VTGALAIVGDQLAQAVGPVLSIIGVIAAAIAALGFSKWTGRRQARKEAKRETALEAAERQAATRKRMDEADTGNDDPRLWRDWLRERGQ
jgi:type II secretory pathway pseudopilin PulG